MQHTPLSETEGIFNPVYRLMSRREGYGTNLIMTHTRTWTELIVSIDEFCDPETFKHPDDMNKFLTIAQSIVGFDPVVFFSTLLAHDMIDRDSIQSIYAWELRTYKPLMLDSDLANTDETINYLTSDKNQILYFEGSSVVYASFVFSLPSDINQVFFDQMQITSNVIRITYVSEDKRMYKQTTKMTKDEINIAMSRSVPTERDEENGLLIVMSIDAATININITKWYISISSSKVIDIKPVIAKLNLDWGILVHYIFVSKAKYEMVIRDIQYEKIMYYWGLSKSQKYREFIDPKEVSSQFWSVSGNDMKFIVTPDQDKYSLAFANGVKVKATIFEGNAYVPKYQHQPDHMNRLLKMNVYAANKEHAKYIMFYMANSIKEIMSDWRVLGFELDQILLDRNNRPTYIEYMKAYTRRLLGTNAKSAKRIFKLNNHNIRYLSKYYDTELYSLYNIQCKSQQKPIISDPVDYDIWTNAGFNTLVDDDKLYICRKRKINKITVSIADMSYTFYCCKSTKQEITHISDVKGTHSDFLRPKRHPVIKPLSDSMLFGFLSTWSDKTVINKTFVRIPDKFLLIHCIAFALDIDDPFDVIRKSKLLDNDTINLDLSGDVFIDHNDVFELMEEIFHITLVVFELSDMVQRNKTLERPIVFVNCLRGMYGEPFYHLISFMYLESNVSVLYPGGVLYNHFSPIISDMSITNKTNDGTTEPVKFMYIPLPGSDITFPSIFLTLEKSNKVLIVTGQVLDTDGMRVISIVSLQSNEQYNGPTIEGLVYHAASAPYPVETKHDVSGYMIHYSVWLAHGVSPSFVSRHSMVEENNVARYTFICDVDDKMMGMYPHIDDPKFIVNRYDTDVIDVEIATIKETESMNRLLLNIITQVALLTDDIWTVIVFVSGLDISSWTRDHYRLVGTIDELLEVAELCMTCFVNGELHSPTSTGTIVVDDSLVDDVDYFLSYIRSRVNFSDMKGTLNLSPNADKFFFETDYTQGDGVLTFINQSNLWKYSDSLLDDSDRATIYISPYLSMKDSPYKLKVGEDVFIAYNVNSDQEAEWIINQYYNLGDIPDRTDMIGVKLFKTHEAEYVRYRISNSRNTKVAVPTDNVDKKIYKILHYPVHYNGYRQAALLISQ
jgi:hypothetical protein